MIQLAESDREEARQLIAHPSATYVIPRVRQELAILIESGVKVESDAITPRLAEDYPKKLLDSDLIKL